MDIERIIELLENCKLDKTLTFHAGECILVLAKEIQKMKEEKKL